MTPPNASPSKAPPIQIFVSYSHENSTWFGRLRPLLNFQRHDNIAHAWHDQKLRAGDQWDNEIRDALEKMDVFVCLLSYEFLNSNYIQDVELERALARKENEEIEIVPIVLYPMNLRADCPELCVFNPLPSWGKCWAGYGNYRMAHKPIRDGLRQAIEKARGRND